jgi:membrane protein involved in colicin uptake
MAKNRSKKSSRASTIKKQVIIVCVLLVILIGLFIYMVMTPGKTEASDAPSGSAVVANSLVDMHADVKFDGYQEIICYDWNKTTRLRFYSRSCRSIRK